MITAKVTAVMTVPDGGDAKVFARSQTLISSENPNGEVMFYAAPPFWTGGRVPYAGQAVMIGRIERKTSPHWPRPKWLARDVSSERSIQSYAPRRLHEPTILTQPTSGFMGRILASLGINSRRVSELY
ncbi:MAG TPA: hypothetical protein VHC20_05375 [Candidatus Paceibacterota bacterium]|nr:hypothetical protein [Candidatus Paceibacterota bacterium]